MLEHLVRFGIPEKEAKVYLSLLELGPSSVSDVAKRAKVSRTNTYHLLNALLSRGLVNSHEKTAKVIFSAEPPQRILQILKNQADECQRMIKEAEQLLPELSSVYRKDDNKLRVRFYEGAEGIISVYEDTLTAQSEILAYASVEDQHDFFPGYFPAYYTRRSKEGISARCLLANNDESKRIQSLDKAHLRVSRLIPEEYGIFTELNIYDNKVVMMSFREKFGAIIESKEVTNAFKKLFELAWEKAEDYNEKLGGVS